MVKKYVGRSLLYMVRPDWALQDLKNYTDYELVREARNFNKDGTVENKEAFESSER